MKYNYLLFFCAILLPVLQIFYPLEILTFSVEKAVWGFFAFLIIGTIYYYFYPEKLEK